MCYHLPIYVFTLLSQKKYLKQTGFSASQIYFVKLWHFQPLFPMWPEMRVKTVGDGKPVCVVHWLALSPPSKAVTQDRAGIGYTQPVAFCGLSSDRQWMNEDSVYENNLILNKHTHININIQPRFKVVLPLMPITEKWQMCKNRTKWIHRCPMPVALVCLAVPLYWIWYFRRDGE